MTAVMKIATATLPNQVQLQCPNAAEALAIYEDCQWYFKHGIKLEPGATVVDVGAHVGIFTSMAAELCQRKMTAYVFEPIPQLASLLTQNMAQLEPADVQIYNCALGNTTGTAEFAFHPETPMLSSAFPDETDREYMDFRETLIRNSSGPDVPERLQALSKIPRFLRGFLLDQTLKKHFRHERLSCPVYRLDQIPSMQSIPRIDLLKINAEKSEEMIFQGLEQLWSVIQQVVVEVHDLDGRLDRLRNHLTSQGFAHVDCDQMDILKGSQVYLLYATRSSAA